MKQDLLNFSQWKPETAKQLLELALDVKLNPQVYKNHLAGKSIAGVFEKPSLRTRVSFDIGINKMGGHFVYLDVKQDKLAGRESTKDTAANLGCWADAIVARVYEHKTLKLMSAATSVPVVNALCDLYHPCQALADFLAIKEVYGDLQQAKLAYIGDGNNVAHSLMILGAALGANVSVVTPARFEPDPEITDQAQTLAQQNGANIQVIAGIENLHHADVLYTDTWISMGDDTPLEQIKATFEPYQLNTELMQKVGANHAMHCQPAHRDLEITSDVVDGSQSLLLLQAENRMHAQNAILLTLLDCL